MAEKHLSGCYIPPDKRRPEANAAGFFDGFALDEQRGGYTVTIDEKSELRYGKWVISDYLNHALREGHPCRYIGASIFDPKKVEAETLGEEQDRSFT